ncbi:gag-pol polyprotein, partial [Tanacetum coccineum]
KDVYMSLPGGYSDVNDKRVCKLVKSSYGLKQTPRKWNEKLVFVLSNNCFMQSMNDFSLFIKNDKDVILVLLVHVDDIIVTGNNLKEITKFKQFLSTKFLTKDLGKLKYFLGIEVLDVDDGICLTQMKYCTELLFEFGMLACKPCSTPIEANPKNKKVISKFGDDEALTVHYLSQARNREETLTLEQESRLKLNKDLVKPYEYTKQNSLYEIFKPPSREYLDQLAQANEVRKKMWRKSFVKTKPNIVKNICFLPTEKTISKSRQAYNVMTNNINHFKQIVDLDWEKHTHNAFRAPTTEDMTLLLKTCLMPRALKTQNDSFKFVSEHKKEMFADLEYVQSLEKEIDELEFDKADFSNI